MGHWMEVWSQLTESNPTGALLNGSNNNRNIISKNVVEWVALV